MIGSLAPRVTCGLTLLVVVSGCGLSESDFLAELDAGVRRVCTACGGDVCEAPPRDTDDRGVEDACTFRRAHAVDCLNALDALGTEACTAPDDGTGAFDLPEACTLAYRCKASEDGG